MARKVPTSAKSPIRSLLILVLLGITMVVAPRTALADAIGSGFALEPAGASVQGAEPTEDPIANVPTSIIDAAVMGDSAGTELQSVEPLDADNWACLGAYVDFDKAYEVLRIMNQERAKVSLPPLHMEEDLLFTAMGRAMESAIVFSHTRPNGTLCFTTFPDNLVDYGENLAYGSITPAGAMDQWMNSPGHRDNILHSGYRSVGVGCIVHNGDYYWCQCFGTYRSGSSSSDCAQPSNGQYVIETPLTTGTIHDTSYNVDYRLNPKLDTPTSLTVGLGECDAPLTFSQLNPGPSHGLATLFSPYWESSDPNVVSVDEDGVMTGVKEGNATLTCDLSGFHYTVNVLVRDGVPVYRLYNPWTHEHLYTTEQSEYENLGSTGWNQEGVAWLAPTSSSTPVLRLYNPNNGDHHYTTNRGEYDQLARSGWQGEGTKFYGADSSGTPVYRLFNPYNDGPGAHHYTTNASERADLVRSGWNDENVGWYGLG